MSEEPTPYSTNATVNSVASLASNVTLLSARVGRRGFTIWNNSSAILYVKLGATATSSDCTKKMAADEFWACPIEYNGQVDGIWASSNGAALVTEIV